MHGQLDQYMNQYYELANIASAKRVTFDSAQMAIQQLEV